MLTPLLLLLVPAMALLRSLFVARCWMSALSDVSWLRSYANAFGENMHAGQGLIGFRVADRIARDAAFSPRAIHVWPDAFPQVLHASRQSLADALGLVMGVAVVTRSRHDGL